MDRLNSKQRRVVWIAIVLAVLMFVFPPAQVGYSYGALFVGYRCLFAMHDSFGSQNPALGILCVQYFLLAIVTWAAVTSLKEKP